MIKDSPTPEFIEKLRKHERTKTRKFILCFRDHLKPKICIIQNPQLHNDSTP